MDNARLFLIHHGAPIVFAAVLIEQLGLPLPSLPWLLAAGALAAENQFSWPLAILVSLVACLIADGIWFYLGRFQGSKVLGVLCRISLEPDSCVRRTQNVFTKYGWRGIAVAKFVPGISTLIPPLAGMTKMNAAHFFAVDGAGSILYCGSFIALGYFFSNQLQRIMGALSGIGTSALILLVGIVAAYIGYKYWQRKRLLGELKMARITVAELRRMIEKGDKVVILDMRSSEEAAAHAGIEGSLRLSLDDIQQGRYQIPPNREVVVYCSCPNEVTAARVALLLRRHGISHVRPLLGGVDAWNEHGSPATV